MRRLLVYLNSAHAGELEQDDGGLMLFRYSQGWLQSPDAVPLSRSLPLRAETFRGKEARAFFAGILPDEAPREVIASILGVSGRNDFALLEKIGGECAGAVTLLPESVPYPVASLADRRELNESELRQIVLELPRRPLLAGTTGLRLSLAGSQPKLPVILDGPKVALPLGVAPSTHIIKPEPDRFPGLVANEAFCMTLAKAVGLEVPDVSTRLVGDRPCIFVRRYDRDLGPGGTVARVHQEDFCQALGIAPEKKYQAEGGPMVRDCVALLRDWSSVPARDIPAFLDGLIFNVLVGNADAHGKNYSLLYRPGERRLAPFYDLVCTLAWPELSKTPAMKIGGGDTLESVTPKHWQKMSAECGTSWPQLRTRVREMARRLTAAAETASVDPAAEPVRRIILERARRALEAAPE